MNVRRIKRTQERYFSAHHLLLSSAERAVEEATKMHPVEDEHSLVVAFTMSALAIEAFFNTVGNLLFWDWQEFETAPTRAKIFLVARELNLSIDRSKTPWQQVFELGRFRNDIVHAKPERIVNTDYIPAAEREQRRFEYPRSRLERRLTLADAERALRACRTAFETIVAKMPEELRLDVVVDGWSTTHEPE